MGAATSNKLARRPHKFVLTYVVLGAFIVRKVKDLSPLLLCLVIFAGGLATGALGLKVLSPDEKAELVSYLQSFVGGLGAQGLEPTLILRLSLVQSAKTALTLWGFGLAVIGAPLTCLLLAARGFALGFSASFVIRDIPKNGAAMFLAGMLPQSLLAVPTLVALSALSISFSLALVRERPWTYGGLWKMILAYTWRFGLVSLGLCASSLVEAYLSPMLLLKTVGA